MSFIFSGSTSKKKTSGCQVNHPIEHNYFTRASYHTIITRNFDSAYLTGIFWTRDVRSATLNECSQFYTSFRFSWFTWIKVSSKISKRAVFGLFVLFQMGQFPRKAGRGNHEPLAFLAFSTCAPLSLEMEEKVVSTWKYKNTNLGL